MSIADEARAEEGNEIDRDAENEASRFLRERKASRKVEPELGYWECGRCGGESEAHAEGGRKADCLWEPAWVEAPRKPEAAPSDTDRATADSALDEVERRLRDGDGYAPSDQVRMALLHIEAYRNGKARRTSQPVQVEVTDDMGIRLRSELNKHGENVRGSTVTETVCMCGQKFATTVAGWIDFNRHGEIAALSAALGGGDHAE